MADGTPIVVPLVANTRELKRGLRSAETRINKFGSRTKKALRGIATGIGVLGAAATATAVKGVQEFVALDTGVREVMTLIGDGSQQAIDKMTKRIESISMEFGIEGTEVAKAFYDSVSAGIDDADVDGFVAMASKLATAGVTSVGNSVDLLTSAINAYGLEAEDAERVSDVFFGAVQGGKTTIGEIATSFAQFGGIASSIGVPLEEVTAWLAQLTLTGASTGQAATRIKSALSELSKPTSKVAQDFKELTGRGFREFLRSGGSLAEALGIIEDIGKKTEGGLAALFGSQEAADAFFGATGEKALQFAGVLEVIEGASGETEKAFDLMGNSADFQWKKIVQSFKNILRDVGEAVLPILESIIPHVGPVMTWIGNAFSDIADRFGPDILDFFNALWPILRDDLGPVLLEMGEDLLPPIVDLFEALMPILTPLIGILAQVVLLLSSGIGLATQFIADGVDKLSEKLGPWLETAEKWASDVAGVVADKLSEAADKVGDAWDDMWEFLKEVGDWFNLTFGPIVIDTIEEIKAFVEDEFLPAWDSIWNDIKDIAKTATDDFEVTSDEWKAIWGGFMWFMDYVIRPAWRIALNFKLGIFNNFIRLIRLGVAQLKWVWKGLLWFLDHVILPAWSWIWNTAIPNAPSAFVSWLKFLFTNVLQPVIHGLIWFFEKVIQPAWNKAWAVLKYPLAPFVLFLKLQVKTIETIINALIWFFEKTILPAWNSVWGALRAPISALSGALNAVVNVAKTAWDWVGKVAGKAGELKNLLPGGGIGGLRNLIPFAEGGIVMRPTAALVGEAGPEAILPLDQLGDMVGGRGTTYIDNRQIVIQGGFATTSELGQLAESALLEWQTHKGPLDIEIASR